MDQETLTTLEVLLKWEQLLYPVIAAFIGGLVWLLRLEAKTNNNHHEVRRLEKLVDKEMQQVDIRLQSIEGMIRGLARDVNRMIGFMGKGEIDKIDTGE